MKVFISVDMEGLAGISHWEPTLRGKDGYRESVQLMVAETNAAIDGAFAGGATAVTVSDSHGRMINLDPVALDPRARVIQGRKPWSMVAGAGPDRGFDVALFVGYHTRAGARGTLAHTFFGSGPVVATLNGVETGETGFNAAVLGAWGVPVGMVSGDDTLAAEVAEQLPWAERVVVKEMVADAAADSVHPTVAAALVRAGAERAVRRAIAGELRLVEAGSPVTVTVEFHECGQAEMAELIPTVERVDDRGIRFQAPDAPQALRTLLATLWLGTLAN